MIPLTVKAGLGVTACAAGIACSVSVPLSMNSSKLNTHTTTNRGGLKESNLVVIKCETKNPSGGEPVAFGQTGLKQVCGSVEGLGVSLNPKIETISGFTNLFKEKGERSQKVGSNSNQGYDGFKTVCGSSGLIMSDSKEDKEILGFCKDGTRDLPTIFVEKRKDERRVSLKMCSENCFLNPKTDVGFTKLETFIGEGKDIEFFAKKDGI